MCGRAIATACCALTCGFPLPSTFTSTRPSASSPTMNATRDHVTARRRRKRLDRSPSTVEGVAAEGKVAEEVGEEDEQHPPERSHRVEPLLPGLDERQVEAQRPGEEQHHRVQAEEPEDQHAPPSLDQIGHECKLPVTIGAMTVRDVILTITLMLGAGLASQIVADYLRAPRMLVLLFAGALLGPSVSGAIDVPLDSMGPQLLLTIGVSFILFHGGLQLSTRVLGGVVVGLVILVLPGVFLTGGVTGGVLASG